MPPIFSIKFQLKFLSISKRRKMDFLNKKSQIIGDKVLSMNDFK